MSAAAEIGELLTEQIDVLENALTVARLIRTDETATAFVQVGVEFWSAVDAADIALVLPYRWQPLHGHNGKVYAYNGSIYMHRLIANTPAGYETDHQDGDGLNNRRSNLRVATASQNRANMGKPRRPDGSAHTSRYKGVSFDRSRSLWAAKIAVNGRHRNLGRYADEAAAGRAYDRAALEAWGPFASLNFPGGEQ